MLCGRSPWGLGGAVYLLIYLFVRDCLFINIRSLILSIGGYGDIIKSCISILDRQVLSRRIGSSCIIKGY